MKKSASQAQYFTAFMLYQALEDHNWCSMDDRTFDFLINMAIEIDKEDRHEEDYEPCAN